MRYVFVTMSAAMVATVIGASCLAADGSIAWSEFWPASWIWFAGVWAAGDRPISAVHVCPWVSKQLSPKALEASHEGEPVSNQPLGSDPAVFAEGVGQVAAMLVTLWVMFGPRLGHS